MFAPQLVHCVETLKPKNEHFRKLGLTDYYFPDTSNKPHFPQSVLNAGEVYTHSMIHKFSTV